MKVKDNYTKEEIRAAKEMKKMRDKIKKDLPKWLDISEERAKELEEKRREKLGI